MKAFLLVVFVAVAFGADDGSYRPEHHGGAYTGSFNNGRYYTGAVPFRTFIPAASAFQPVYQRVIQPAVQPVIRYQPTTIYAQYQSLEGNVQTIRDSRSQSPNGDYAFDFETQNGIAASEQSQVVAPDSQRKSGFYQYTGPDGQLHRVDWVADENGYRATGAHLPVPPPVPEAIQRSIDYNLRNAPRQ